MKTKNSDRGRTRIQYWGVDTRGSRESNTPSNMGGPRGKPCKIKKKIIIMYFN